MFRMLEQARKNNDNPIEIFKQITGNYSPEQMNAFYQRAEQMGISPDILKQFK